MTSNKSPYQPNMIKIVDTKTENPFAALSKRTIHRDEETERIVKAIIDDVRRRGDEALLDNARKFDAPSLERLLVTNEEFASAEGSLSDSERRALHTAAQRIEAFHQAQFTCMVGNCVAPMGSELQNPHGARFWYAASFQGGALGQRIVPLGSAGVYVPGGNANYPSSVLMNAIPAVVAGIDRLVITTPSRKDGTLSPSVLYAAQLLKQRPTVVKIGGAAAIAALALGTESVPRVDKIVGPGNRFVNEAKRQLWGAVGLDGYAGPSEVCVLADKTANAKCAAIDFLTQIEHAPDNSGFLVCTDEAKFREILSEIDTLVTGERREETVRQAMAGDSIAFLAKDLEEACDIVNAIAPEHLSIACRDFERALHKVQNAGCILLGEWSPESAGDFVAGPSHTLPTSGAARFQSPVNVLDFLKVQSVIRLSREELKSLAPNIEAFGTMEGFPLHGRGATIRFEE